MLRSIEERQKAVFMPMHATTRHMLGLFNGLRGARHFRQVLGTDTHTPVTPARDIMEKALGPLKLL